MSRCRSVIHIWPMQVGSEVAGVKQAAEKLRISCEIERKSPSGAEGQLILLTLSARLKSCPDTSRLALSSFPFEAHP